MLQVLCLPSLIFGDALIKTLQRRSSIDQSLLVDDILYAVVNSLPTEAGKARGRRAFSPNFLSSLGPEYRC